MSRNVLTLLVAFGLGLAGNHAVSAAQAQAKAPPRCDTVAVGLGGKKSVEALAGLLQAHETAGLSQHPIVIEAWMVCSW